jgi:hypothetical protein
MKRRTTCHVLTGGEERIKGHHEPIARAAASGRRCNVREGACYVAPQGPLAACTDDFEMFQESEPAHHISRAHAACGGGCSGGCRGGTSGRQPIVNLSNVDFARSRSSKARKSANKNPVVSNPQTCFARSPTIERLVGLQIAANGRTLLAARQRAARVGAAFGRRLMSRGSDFQSRRQHPAD